MRRHGSPSPRANCLRAIVPTTESGPEQSTRRYANLPTSATHRAGHCRSIVLASNRGAVSSAPDHQPSSSSTSLGTRVHAKLSPWDSGVCHLVSSRCTLDLGPRAIGQRLRQLSDLRRWAADDGLHAASEIQSCMAVCSASDIDAVVKLLSGERNCGVPSQGPG